VVHTQYAMTGYTTARRMTRTGSASGITHREHVPAQTVHCSCNSIQTSEITQLLRRGFQRMET
jgi:hypothetical protein